VVVRSEDFAEFNLTLKSVPDTVDDPESLEQCDCAIGCCSIDRWGARPSEFGGGCWAGLLELFEHGLAGSGIAIAGIF